MCGVGIPVPRGWGDVRNQTSGQGGGRKPGLMASGSRAGVTTCVCLSWASSRASGGPWPSSAGSATEPSASCCRPSTSPTCTACGKPCPWGAALSFGSVLFPGAQVCPGDRGARVPLSSDPVRLFRSNRNYCPKQNGLQGAGSARTKRPSCLCFKSRSLTSSSIIKA